MRKTLPYLGWILSVILFICWLDQHGAKSTAENKADTLRNIITQKLPQIVSQGKAIKDSSVAREKRDTELSLVKHDTSSVIKKADTVNENLRKILASSEKNYEDVLLKKNDSLKLLKNQNKNLIARVDLLTKSARNISFFGSNKKLDADTLNASIYAIPFKQSSHKSIFSPQKNFLRIYNQNPIGTVNNKPFYDYEQTNDEINQFILQVRSSYNFNTQTTQVGGGFELKLNRLGIGAAVFFSPFKPKQPVYSIGLREDVFNIKFK